MKAPTKQQLEKRDHLRELILPKVFARVFAEGERRKVLKVKKDKTK